jgi:4-amino-4-deoxy-L-arabinose transferase-like glycosyltransferase
VRHPPARPAAAEARDRTWRARGGRVLPVLVAMAAGALVALVSAYALWPRGSIDLDEIVYLNQADAIAHGDLAFDRATTVPDFRPYLSGVAGDRVVFKYQPLWPAVLAGSALATGDHRPALVVAGAVAALAVWSLARELTGRRWAATAAAVGVALSPVFVTQSGTALAYLPAAALGSAALAAGLRAVRTGARWWYVLAGAGLGLLFFHRPYDALVTGLPLAAWLAVRARRDRAPGPLVAVIAGGAPFVALWPAYNRLVTGDWLRPAFAVDAPEDRFGFGRRASWAPVDPQFPRGMLDFTPAGSARTVVHFATQSHLWVAGGVVALALAAVGAAGARTDPRRRVLVAVAVLAPAAHALWWGTQNFVSFGLDKVFGPAYWLAALGPVAALAAAGGIDVTSRAGRWPAQRRRVAVAGAAVAVAASTVASAVAIAPPLGRARDGRDEQVAVVDRAAPGAVVLVPGAVDDPFVHALVPADPAPDDRLAAVDLGRVDQVFRLLDRFPDRPLWRWVPDRPAGSVTDPPRGYRLGELPALRAPTATVALTPARPGAVVTQAWVRTLDADGLQVDRRDLVPGPGGGVGAVAGPPAGGPEADLDLGPGPGYLAVGATVERPGWGSQTVEVRWPARSVRGGVEVVGPGTGQRLYDVPAGTVWSPEDVSDVVTAAVEGLGAFRPVAEERRVA